MIHKISCEICRDLMPLVRDGVALHDSWEAVLQHLKECPDCKAIFDREPAPVQGGEHGLQRVMRKLQIFTGMLMMFGILYGLSLTAGGDLFYNVILMPLIGGVGYYLFRWKALYRLPLLLTVTHFFSNLAGMGNEYLDAYSLLLWSFLYSTFACLGVIIAALLHFVFRREA